MSTAGASVAMLKAELGSPDGLQDREMGRKLQGTCPALVSPVTPVKLCCWCLRIIVLTVAVVVVSVVLSAKKPEQVIMSTVCAACPRNWIGFGSKCFYFSEDMRNWTHSQASCTALEGQLAEFKNLEELDFLKRYMGSSDHWIGLRRESSQQPWKWADNTKYNNMVSIRGVGECAYLSDNGISSDWDYLQRKWICSKPNSYTLHYPAGSGLP